MTVRGRFAPSPTGFIHIGNAFTAVLAWQQVRQAGGEFVLRIEDVDVSRSKQAYIDALIEDLCWLGLDWDEGPDVGGPFEPYTQQTRTRRYEEAFLELDRRQHVFPCFCSRSDLVNALSAPHGLFGDEPRYKGICRTLSSVELEARMQTRAPAYRFRVEDREIEFVDGVYGKCGVNPADGGDFIIRRSDGLFGYQLAVVVDDAEMNITHVLRGADLLSSTPRQILLYEALGFDVPQFTHVPIVLDERGERIAKRNPAWTIREMRRAGVRSEDVIGVIANMAGMSERVERLTLTEWLPDFCMDRIPRETVRLTEAMKRRLLPKD